MPAPFAVIKSKSGENERRIGLPDGSYQTVRWTKANDFTAKVPTQVTYRDPVTRKVKVFDDAFNWAQHLLDTSPDLELVEVVEPPKVESPAVVQPERSKPTEGAATTPPKRRGRPPKEEVKDEKETPV